MKSPKHCSAPTQHYHGWKCAEKCRHLQIPRQLHKLCSQPWWWGSVPHLTSKPGIWAPPHPSKARAGHLDQDQAERIPSCCATVSPVGCETWTCYRRHTKKLDQFHLRCLRKVLRVSWKEHVPNQEILRWAELTGIEAMLNQAQLRWSGHVTHIDDSRLPKQLFHAELSTCKRHKGGQRKQYKDVLKSTLKACNIPVDEGKPWPRTGRPGGQLHARAQSTLREADYRAWMIRDRQGRTECQTLALLYLVSSAARYALPLSAPSSYVQTPALTRHLRIWRTTTTKKGDLRSLPCTEDAFTFHAQRALHQLVIYKQATQPDPLLPDALELEQYLHDGCLFSKRMTKSAKPYIAKTYCKCKNRKCGDKCPCHMTRLQHWLPLQWGSSEMQPFHYWVTCLLLFKCPS